MTSLLSPHGARVLHMSESLPAVNCEEVNAEVV